MMTVSASARLDVPLSAMLSATQQAGFFLIRRRELFHRGHCGRFFAVNNVRPDGEERLEFIGGPELFARCSPPDFGEQPVHINSLSNGGKRLCCGQFIERAGTSGDGRKKVIERPKDTPGRPGKGWARLVGAAPL
jgi:hypothetical protein